MACPLRYKPEGVGVLLDAAGAKQSELVGRCIGERCDWWDEREEECVMVVQARHTRQLHRFLAAWYVKQFGGVPSVEEVSPTGRVRAPSPPWEAENAQAHTSEAYRDALGLADPPAPPKRPAGER